MAPSASSACVKAPPRTPRSVWRCWRTCKRGAWTRASPCSWCSMAPRPCTRPPSGSGGQNGVIQRCQVHKRRNVKAHVPDKHHAELERRLSEAYHETGYEAAKASLEATARWRERINADAASSLREGLEETL